MFKKPNIRSIIIQLALLASIISMTSCRVMWVGDDGHEHHDNGRRRHGRHGDDHRTKLFEPAQDSASRLHIFLA